jgi:hypothetical protein
MLLESDSINSTGQTGHTNVVAAEHLLAILRDGSLSTLITAKASLQSRDGSWSIVLAIVLLVVLLLGALIIFMHLEGRKQGSEILDNNWRRRNAPTTSRDVRIPHSGPKAQPQLHSITQSNPSISPRSTLGHLHPHLEAHNSTANADDDDIAEFDGTGGNYHFCEDLVVPPYKECMLLVPIRHQIPTGAFNVTDTSGSVVLHVSVRGSSSAPLAQVQATGASQRRLVLSTATGETLVQCCTSATHKFPLPNLLPDEGLGTTEFKLLRAAGDYYASLLRCEPPNPEGTRYLLKTIRGTRFHFWGAFERHAVNITDERGKLLATTEVCQVDFDTNGQYYRLRVAPLTDVGLILCGLLCIHHLDTPNA